MKTAQLVVSVVFVVGILTAFAFYELAKFNECRRVHPTWYCVVD